jgi:hypothetical protein
MSSTPKASNILGEKTNGYQFIQKPSSINTVSINFLPAMVSELPVSTSVVSNPNFTEVDFRKWL